jgi:cell division protein FtsN
MASTRRKQREQLPGWAWMLFGLSIGLGFALFVYLQSNELVISDSLRELTSEIRPAEREPAPDTEPARPEPATADEPAATESAEADEPGLSFYTRLRDSEVVVPGSAPATRTETPSGTQTRLPQPVELQAGSFPSPQGADTRQATLALLGITSRIDPAMVGDTMHYRVIIGPLTESEEMNRISRRLDREEIEYFRRRVSAPD